MIELTILNYMSGALDIPVYMEKPSELPNKYVVIEKTGGGKDEHLYTAMMTFKSYAPTLYQAAELNEEVKSIMDVAADNLADVSRSQLNSDYNYTDTQTKSYRYQAVYDIWHY